MLNGSAAAAVAGVLRGFIEGYKSVSILARSSAIVIPSNQAANLRVDDEGVSAAGYSRDSKEISQIL